MGNTNTSYNDTDPKEFDRLGHPGKFWNVITHTGGITHFTGSNYGYGGAMLASGSVSEEPKGFIELSGGGTVLISDLPQLESNIIDISVRMVSSSVSAPSIYFFKRQQ